MLLKTYAPRVTLSISVTLSTPYKTRSLTFYLLLSYFLQVDTIFSIGFGGVLDKTVSALATLTLTPTLTPTLTLTPSLTLVLALTLTLTVIRSTP